jgi:hypothetical protein
MTRSKGLRKFIIIILAELAVLAAVVWFFDPFYQYHEPLGGMKAVLNDRDNQVVGTIRNFEYDSVLVGSSVAENFDSEYLNQYYDCTTLKIIRASGSVADLRYYLDMAHENQKLKNVFWCLDIFALNAPLQVTLYDEGIPRYLHTASVLDDIPYVWNKEILFEKIPFMLAAGLQGKNTGGQAYDWSEDKVFGPEKAMQAYQKPKEYLPSPQDVEEYKEIIAANIAVSGMILTRREQMEPVIVRVHTDLKSETARVILANSITLTPGTITVSMTDNDLLVHCLDKSLSEGMDDSVFVRLLKKMEEE